jgi:hypothetical protein
MYSPQFPYKGNQLILTSDRVMLHSKNDAIFIFGKQAVSLSSPQTINLDASQKVLIDSPKIELGRKAETDGEPIILGRTFNRQLTQLLDELAAAGTLLAQVSTTNLGASMQYISISGTKINQQATILADIIRDPNSIVLSKNTFTK